MFQDHGAAGRMPVLIPVTWKQDPDSPEGKKLPVFGDNGKMPKKIEVASIRPDYQYKSLFTSDIFDKESEKQRSIRYGSGTTSRIRACGEERKMEVWQLRPAKSVLMSYRQLIR